MDGFGRWCPCGYRSTAQANGRRYGFGRRRGQRSRSPPSVPERVSVRRRVISPQRHGEHRGAQRGSAVESARHADCVRLVFRSVRSPEASFLRPDRPNRRRFAPRRAWVCWVGAVPVAETGPETEAEPVSGAVCTTQDLNSVHRPKPRERARSIAPSVALWHNETTGISSSGQVRTGRCSLGEQSNGKSSTRENR